MYTHISNLQSCLKSFSCFRAYNSFFFNILIYIVRFSIIRLHHHTEHRIVLDEFPHLLSPLTFFNGIINWFSVSAVVWHIIMNKLTAQSRISPWKNDSPSYKYIGSSQQGAEESHSRGFLLGGCWVQKSHRRGAVLGMNSKCVIIHACLYISINV